MRFTRIRWFRALVAATFLWSNVAVAAHACIAEIAAQAEDAVVVQESVQEGCGHGQPAAPADPSLCFVHCMQAGQAPAQKIAIGVPGVVCAPVLLVLHPSFQAAPAAPVLALAVPVAGPPLTILLRNFRI